MRVQRCGLIDYPAGQIFSIDFHPNGKYLATCGNDGKGKGLVTIWDTAFLDYVPESEEENPPQEEGNDSMRSTASSVLSMTKDHENDYNKFKIGEKDFYSNNQNCVRWSRVKKGRWLASCGDNSVVYLYEPVFNSEKNQFWLENPISLTGHTMEVLQVEFSTNGRYMASCSLDNSIIIWTVEEQPQKIQVLNRERGGHTHFVTGLAWDPAEKFLATQSMDKTLKLWRCDNWECERTIEGHFSSPSRTSLFFRLDWSTDGAFLIATCAENNGFQTAKLIVRKEFKQEHDFLGFSAPVSCVRSSDRCTFYEDPSRGTVTINLLAIGSLDQSVSVWLLPYVSRPLCVLQNVFPEGILDLSWSRGALSIVGISGSVRCLVFDESEIGRFLSGREMCDHFDTLYGRIPYEFKEYQRRLNEEGGTEWIKEILKGVYEPKEQLTSQATACHECMLCHNLVPSCPKCRNLYSQISEQPM